eukprot:TRINITY_DN2408_c0_g1_i1.p1 TRINITY_DN2408_c0_g1~~TRINITY_DN2408_c0_g1_i1.p1  ORF type:complete len:744 (+),score=105.04 TRINITY_DN2408_c0_g1_i1:2311-4542(+)
MTCREELDSITNAIKYVVWPISSDVKKYFVSQMFHLVEAKCLWEEITGAINGKKLMAVANDETLMAKIHQCLYDFDYIKKAVECKCEEWRVTFPRLFLMNDEKLINFMEDFPKTCAFSDLFQFTNLVMYQDKEIRAVKADKGEELRLIHPVKIGPHMSPAKVLRKLEKSMRESIKEEIMSALKNRTQKKEWYMTHLSQAVCVSLWVEWTRSIEEAFKGTDPQTGLAQCLDLYRTELKTLIQELNVKTDPCPAKPMCIIMTLHSLVLMLEELVKNQVTKDTAPLWRNKMKFYWKNDTIIIKCDDNIVEYGYEFYGCRRTAIHYNESRNIAYPLVMSSFKHLIMASLSGETGTGKNLAVQDMAFILGKPVYTFYCTSDTKMTNLENATRAAGYSGGILIACELNRMQDEKKCMELWVKMLELREAGCKELVEEGRRLPLGKNYTVVATIHAGYEKILSYLTNVVLPVPDYNTVAEGIFYVGGCLNAKDLADNLVKCVTDLKNKLSHAPQYMFNLRLVKDLAVLTKYLSKQYNLEEVEAMAQAFHSLVWSRLEKGDYKFYEETIKVHFGTKAPLRVLNVALFKALAESPAKLPEELVHACCYMYDVMQCNMNALMIAPDDKIVGLLAEAIAKIYPAETPLICAVDMNASSEQLFGRYQNDTWIPGHMDKMILGLDDCKPTWLVFKGTLDQKADNLLPLMEQVKMFVSPSGMVKKLSERTKVMFVTPTVEKMTPPLISRMAIFKMTQ